MARAAAALLLLLTLCAVAAPALAHKSSSRRLDSSYPSSGSSPVVSTPSPEVTDTPPYPSSGSSPSSSSPSISIPPVISSPSPVVIPPVTASPSGGYGGYGSHSGKGTCGFFKRNPGKIPRLLSLASSLVKLFGPRLLKFFKGGKPPSLLGALKDESPLPIASLTREGSASLINAYTLKDFPLSAAQVIGQFNAGLESEDAAAQRALEFQQLNEGV